MLDLQKSIDAEEMINAISCTPTANIQSRTLELNSNPNINSAAQDYTNSNQAIDPQLLLLPTQYTSKTANISPPSPNVQNNSITPSMMSQFPDNNHIVETEPLHIDIEDRNEVMNSQDFNSRDERSCLLSVENINLQAQRCITPLAEEPGESFEEQLHIDIEPDDDTMHSWRPNLANANSPCDFFLPHHLPSSDAQNCVFNMDDEVKKPLSMESYWEEAGKAYNQSKPQVLLPVPSLSSGSGMSIDLRSHLHRQKMQVNVLKYELANSKLELQMWRNGICALEKELNERLHFPNAHEIKLLNEEIKRLQNECQCLCMEVDHYVKGKAPLGEVNEDFYKSSGILQKRGKTKKHSNPNTEAQPSATQETETEELKTWECSVCTFANHPELNSCEICHTQREVLSNARLCASTNSTCYCHPSEGSLPISS